MTIAAVRNVVTRRIMWHESAVAWLFAGLCSFPATLGVAGAINSAGLHTPLVPYLAGAAGVLLFQFLLKDFTEP